MRHPVLLLLLALSACDDNLSHTPPPMDHFFSPAGLALTPVAGSNQPALLVVSSNFDLRYDKERGATLLSVDPGAYDAVAGTGGSLGRPGGNLVKLGEGGRLGSYAGPVAVANASTCPGLIGPGPGRTFVASQALVASRYTHKLYRFPVDASGAVAPCSGDNCEMGLDNDLLDPAPIGLACRADGLRQSAFVSYLRSPYVGRFGAGTAWLSEFDLADLASVPRTFAMAPGPVADMAYDDQTDRLYAVGRFAGLTAPLFILELPRCPSSDQVGCLGPRLQTVDLYASLAGAELVGIALSNLQPARPRRAYISVRVYDEAYAAAIRSRPSFDVGGALMVVDIEEDVVGQPSARVRAVVPIGLGAGPVRVLPVRPGLADLVVVPSSGDGTIQIYDDEVGAVVRVVSADPATGSPETGHVPFATAVEDRGTDALVYIASFRDGTVSVLRVPLANPTSADLLRDTAGKPLRIGSSQP
jgi:hypothetical protein